MVIEIYHENALCKGKIVTDKYSIMLWNMGSITMTISQIFECSIGRKTVWTKRGGEVSKRSVMPVSTIQSRTIIAPKVNPKS